MVQPPWRLTSSGPLWKRSGVAREDGWVQDDSATRRPRQTSKTTTPGLAQLEASDSPGDLMAAAVEGLIHHRFLGMGGLNQISFDGNWCFPTFARCDQCRFTHVSVTLVLEQITKDTQQHMGQGRAPQRTWDKTSHPGGRHLQRGPDPILKGK